VCGIGVGQAAAAAIEDKYGETLFEYRETLFQDLAEDPEE